jgi:predicted PurR-regulated permease PerM
MSHAMDSNRLRQVFLIGLILFLGVVIFTELYSFLPALLGSITLYILMRNILFFLTEKKNWPAGLAAIVLMLASLLVILLPIGLLVNMLSSKVAYGISHSEEWIAALSRVVEDLKVRYRIEILSQENINKLGSFVADLLPRVLGATFNTISTIFFMYFILYFMLTSGKKMEAHLQKYLPFKAHNVHKLEQEVHNMVVSNAVGIPVVAMAQGLVGLLGYWLIGVNEPFFWFGVTCIAGMLPVIGAALAYIPLIIIFFANGQYVQGVVMLVYGFGVIGTVDNILRFTLLKKIGDVHPLTTVFGVIAGLSLFGFIGLIFGPLLISLLMLLVKIYYNEFID